MKKLSTFIISIAFLTILSCEGPKGSTISTVINETIPVVNAIDSIIQGTGTLENSTEDINNLPEEDFDEDQFNVPESFALQGGPPIINQKSTSKCRAFALGYYITSMYNGAKISNSKNLGSPEYLYSQYKKINKDENCNKSCYLFDVKDKNIIGLVQILQDYGTTTLEDLPVNLNNSYTVITDDLKQKVESNRSNDFYNLTSDQLSNPLEIKNWIYTGYPLFISIKID